MQYSPSWQTALGFGGLVGGAALGLALRVAQNPIIAELSIVDKDVCKAGFSNWAVQGFNWLGQQEIKACAIAFGVLVPLSCKIA